MGLTDLDNGWDKTEPMHANLPNESPMKRVASSDVSCIELIDACLLVDCNKNKQTNKQTKL